MLAMLGIEGHDVEGFQGSYTELLNTDISTAAPSNSDHTYMAASQSNDISLHSNAAPEFVAFSDFMEVDELLWPLKKFVITENRAPSLPNTATIAFSHNAWQIAPFRLNDRYQITRPKDEEWTDNRVIYLDVLVTIVYLCRFLSFFY
jgi:hypothetical protein